MLYDEFVEIVESFGFTKEQNNYNKDILYWKYPFTEKEWLIIEINTNDKMHLNFIGKAYCLSPSGKKNIRSIAYTILLKTLKKDVLINWITTHIEMSKLIKIEYRIKKMEKDF